MAHDAAKLRELLERVDRASGPDREIETGLFQVLIGVDAHDAKRWYGGGFEASVTKYLDASIALVERMLPGWKWVAGKNDDNDECICIVGDRVDVDFEGIAATVPLAILSALLRALISQAEGESA